MKHLLASLLILSFALVAKAQGDDELIHLFEVADSLHSVGRTDSAVVVGEDIIALAVKSENPTYQVAAYSAQGVYLRSLGRIDEALDAYCRGLEIVTSGKFRENPDQDAIDEIASLYINLAVLNLDMQSKDDAARNAEFAGKWVERSDDIDLRSTIFGVAGSVLTGCGKLDVAMQYQDKAYSNALKADNKEAAFRAAAYAMLCADRSGDKPAAQQWRDRCRQLMPEITSPMALLVYY